MYIHSKDLIKAINNVEPLTIRGDNMQLTERHERIYYMRYGKIKKFAIILDELSRDRSYDNYTLCQDFKKILHEFRKRDYVDLIYHCDLDEFMTCIPGVYRESTWKEFIASMEYLATDISEWQAERAHDRAMQRNVEDYENQY
jgi:hypothetical protein